MRLSEEQIKNLKESVLNIDGDAAIYLFGSRTDDSKRGGDIDLLIVSDKIKRKDIWKVRDRFFDNFGEQKLDIIVDNGLFEEPFANKVYSEGIKL